MHSPRPLLAGLLLLAATAVAQDSAETAEAEPRVTAIEVRSDVALEDAASLLAFAPGQRLTESAVRRTLRNLHATGRASQVEIHTRPAAGTAMGAVEVVVAVWGTVLVTAVEVEGELGLEEAALRAVLVQERGQPLLESRVLRGLYEMQDLYRERGYLQATVRLDVDVDDATRRARVTYRVASGPRARVAAVEFHGDLGPFTQDRLEPRLRAGAGDFYNARVVREDAERLRRWLLDQGYRTAEVDRPEVTFDEPTPAVSLAYPLRVGPRVEVVVEGADKDELRDEGLLPFLGEAGYDPALVRQAVDLLRDHYQEKGHYRVEIEQREEELEDGALRLVLTVVPGPELHIESLRFSGNRAFPASRLDTLIATSPRALLGLVRGHLVDSVLAADLENLRSFYALEGYWDVRVGPPEIAVEEPRIDLTLPIEEGPRRQVASLDFEGVEGLEMGEVRSRVVLEAGGGFHPRRLEESENALRALYEERGYERAQVSGELDWYAGDRLVDVRLRVLEGPRSRLDRILVRGNRKTRDEVIRRALGLAPGDPVSESRLLEAERRLFRLGIFSGVEIERLPGDPGASQEDIVVRVEEGQVRRLGYGLGYDEEDGARGSVDFSHSNLLGRAYIFQVGLRVSQRDSRGRAVFDQPRLGSLPLGLTSSVFFFEEDRDSFDVTSYGARSELVRERGPRRFGLAADFREVDLANVDAPLNEIERRNREIEIISLIPSARFDHVDDIFNPTEGWSFSGQLQYALPVFEEESHFLKLFLQQTAHCPLAFGVLGASLRGGGIEPLSLGVTASENPVPIAERFFAGGSTTHRAFGRDELGRVGETLLREDPADPSSTLIEVGGNGLLLLNLDYRFPLAGPVEGSVFLDAGNVWRDWHDIDPGELRYGAGVGVRYLSPIGPLRLEVGWKFDVEPGEDGAHISFSFGNPF